MITVSRGDWRKTFYVSESKSSFYSALRKPLKGNPGHDPTTANLSEEYQRIATKPGEEFIENAMQSNLQIETRFPRGVWIWVAGYLPGKLMADPRMKAAALTGVSELVRSISTLEAIRREILDNEEAADDLNDGELRADSRRSMIEYLDQRMLRRVLGRGNDSTVKHVGDPILTLTAGGSWVGVSFEMASVVFPELQSSYARISLLDMTGAMTNAIASLPRDQREDTTNALIPVYRDMGGDLDTDLSALCTSIDNSTGPELSMVGHFVMVNNCHSRHIMLAVFLAAARLGSVSLDDVQLHRAWKAHAALYGEKMVAPRDCFSSCLEDRLLRVSDAVDGLWTGIQAANRLGTDVSIEAAQRALRRFIHEETQHICWQEADPTVLWAVCAALFTSMSRVNGMSKQLLRGDDFKSLCVDIEEFEEDWLRQIPGAKGGKL